MKKQTDLFIFLPFLIIIISMMTAGCQKASKDMVYIPAGEFTMGTDETDTDEKAAEYGIGKPWLVDEHPAHKVNLPAYYIDKYEVTNERYKKFIEATNRKPPADWEDQQIPQGKSKYPVEMVSWEDADAFCRWDGKRLPAEAEWEKAARGTDGRVYPWGNEFDPKKANIGGQVGGTAAVGSYESGKSPYGVYDLIGNVWEWTADWYKPYQESNYENKDYGEQFKVIRGNSWPSIGHFSPEVQMDVASHHSTATFRLYFTTDGAVNDVGFRCAKSDKGCTRQGVPSHILCVQDGPHLSSFSYRPGRQPLLLPWRWFGSFIVLERRICSFTLDFGLIGETNRKYFGKGAGE